MLVREARIQPVCLHTSQVTIELVSYKQSFTALAQIPKLMDEMYPQATNITLMLDSLNTHTGSSLYKAFSPEQARRILDKLENHNTPKHGSRLNMAEIELSILSRQCLDRRIPDQGPLKTEAAA